jgi:hypothetical protein
MIASQDKKFLFEIIKGIQSVEKEKIHHRFFDYENFIAILLTENNLEEYFKTVANVPEIHRRASFPIYIAKRINGKTGEKVYRMTLKLKKIEQPVASPHEEPWEKQQKQQKKRRREQFINLLGKDDKFFTNLFQYYLQSKVELDQFFKTSKGKTSKKRLIKLAVNGINKIDPKKFQVSIQDRSAKKFTWSTQASYFGDLLEVVSIFKPQLIKKYLQKIIDFIPYAYSDDMARIMDMVAEVSNNDLSFVNRVMKDLKNDIRYLVPGTYIYLVGHYAKKGCNLSNAAPVLKSFIDDDEILDYERRNALENLEYVVKKPDEKLKQYLLSLFEEENVIFKNSVNALLITLYKDESAIDWRFAKLKEPIKFDRRRIEGKAHSVGQEERELDSLSFAKPLIELKDEKYLPKFLKLINYSINFYLALEGEENRNTYKEFVNYILRIVIAYVDNLKYIKSFNPVFRLENFIDKKTENYPDLNSLKIRIEELKKSYVNFNSIN